MAAARTVAQESAGSLANDQAMRARTGAASHPRPILAPGQLFRASARTGAPSTCQMERNPITHRSVPFLKRTRPFPLCWRFSALSCAAQFVRHKSILLIEICLSWVMTSLSPVMGRSRNTPITTTTVLNSSAPISPLRLAIAPAYLDGEMGFKHLLSPTTDVGIGLSGGAFGDNFYDVRQGTYLESQSFYGSGGGASASIYQLLDPGLRIPLNLVVRGGFRYATYFDTPETASNFKLPRDQVDAFTRVGLRFAGKQPLLYPALGLELSAWFERQRHFDDETYGIDNDRQVTPATDLYWLYAGLNYEFNDTGDKFLVRHHGRRFDGRGLVQRMAIGRRPSPWSPNFRWCCRVIITRN